MEPIIGDEWRLQLWIINPVKREKICLLQSKNIRHEGCCFGNV
jgi:hypothetical protein